MSVIQPEPKKSKLAIWCLVGKDSLLVEKKSIPELDRFGYFLPSFLASAPPSSDRKQLEDFLRQRGFDATRRPITNLGSPILESHGSHELIQLYGVSFPPNYEIQLRADFELISISKLYQLHRDPLCQIYFDMLIHCANALYFSLPASGLRPLDCEIFASIPISSLRDDYFNLWFPDALRELEPLGLRLEIDAGEPHQQFLRVLGRAPLLPHELTTVRTRLIDLGRHARGRFWVTEIIDGAETLNDYADPTSATKFLPGNLS